VCFELGRYRLTFAGLKQGITHMKIAYLDGERLYRVLYAGIQQVLDDQDYLNKINVFPVPDGDTGTNMAFTLMGVVEGMQSHRRVPLNELGRVVADAALDNARGNSGVILAQFFEGLSEGIVDRVKLSTTQFADAVQEAVKSAYTAMAEPREGTILTVLRRWGEDLREKAEHTRDFGSLIESSMKEAHLALADTPNLLAVLKENGVVDAAGSGFVSMLEGISAFMKQGNLKNMPKIRAASTPSPSSMSADELTSLEYPFCTECIIVHQDLDRKAISARLSSFGDSIIVAGSKQRAKVHIHTDRPGEMFAALESFGEVKQQKVDDMRTQQESAASEGGIALVVDSTCDLPVDLLEKYHIHVVPVRVNFGDDHYIDKVTINADEFYRKLQTDPRHPQTSQPPPGDFKRLYNFLGTHHDALISLHVPRASSGTLQNAENALKSVDVDNKTIFDSASISIGTGLIALELAEAIAAGNSYEEVVALAEHTIPRVKVFIYIESLDAAIRGGRVSLKRKKLIDMLRLNPILTMTPKGKIDLEGVTLGRRNVLDKFERYFLKKIKDRSVKRIGVAHADHADVATGILERLKQRFPGTEGYLSEVCPALGAHAGHHALGIAFQFED